jgi:tetratricopeptide (TPR) repeat protein
MARQLKYGFVTLAILVAAGAAWRIHVASAAARADEFRKLADDACRRFDFRAAHGYLLSYLQLRPTDVEAHLLAGRCARRAEFLADYDGDDPELRQAASHHLSEAERLGAPPETVAVERVLADTQLGIRLDNERLLVERVKNLTPDTPLILEGLIQGYLRHANYEKALACEEALLRMEPGNLQGLLWRGRMRALLRQKQLACEDFESALTLAPDFDPARYYLAETLAVENRYHEVEPLVKVLMEHSPKNLLVRLLWARCRFELGHDSAGVELDAWLQDAPPHHSRLVEALDAAAQAALASSQPRKAEGYARRALTELPLGKQALHNLSRSLGAQGRKQEAQEVEKQLTQVMKDLKIVERVWDRLAKDSTNLELRYELGSAYLRLARPGDALVWLNSVLDREPEHRATLQLLAGYYEKCGQRALAAEMRQRLAACREMTEEVGVDLPKIDAPQAERQQVKSLKRIADRPPGEK